MERDNRSAFRGAMLSGEASAKDLRRRFDEQVAAILAPGLTTWDKIGRVLLICLLLAGIGLVVWGIRLVVSAGGSWTPLGVGLLIAFAAGIIFLVAGICVCLASLKRRRDARADAKVIIYLGFGFFGICFVTLLVLIPYLHATAVAAVWVSLWFMVFLVILATATSYVYSKWHREDILIEQKRAQLKMALLREATEDRAREQ